MSIVKQIVDLSDGRIDVKSDVDQGTQFTLSLPLQNNLPDPPLPSPAFKTEDPVDAVRRRASGRTVSIRGFDNALGKSMIQMEALAALKASIEKYIIEWFNLTIIDSDQLADIIIMDENAYLEASGSEFQFRILLILCSNGARRDMYPSQVEEGKTIECVSKPCGPHRLAKALLNCLETESAAPTPSPEARVSFLDPQLAMVPAQKDATLGTKKNSRLIGALLSTIGFAPTVIDILKSPSQMKTPETMPTKISKSRPAYNRMPSSSALLDRPVLTSPVSASSNAPRYSPAPSNSDKSNILSTVSVDKTQGFKDGSKPVRKGPKMLLVEVLYSPKLAM